MKLAIMQPYLFPYVGYFQLIAAVDRFVVYDDVSYIKGGWINRNRWLVSGTAAYFTIPVQDGSSFRTIIDTKVAQGTWREKLLRTFRQNYARAPHFTAAFDMLKHVVELDEPSIARRAVVSLRLVTDYLGLTTEFIETTIGRGNAELSGPKRVLDLCRREGATIYVNAIGGQELYDRVEFAAADVRLYFLRPRLEAYPQFTGTFVPGLSILDVIAFNPRSRCQELLAGYEFT